MAEHIKTARKAFHQLIVFILLEWWLGSSMNTLNTERLCFPPPDLRRCIRMKLKQICLQFTLLCAFSIVALWQVSSSVQCQPLPHQLIDEAGRSCSAYSGWVLLLVKRFKGARYRISKMRQDAVGAWMLLQLLVVGFIYTIVFFLKDHWLKCITGE